MSLSSKMTLATLTLAAFVATPALAQKYAGPMQLPDRTHYVESGGRVFGADPDVQIRFELLRNVQTYLGAN
jgi:hypothetical protein